MGNVVRWPVLLSGADVKKALVTWTPDLRGFPQAANTLITGELPAGRLENGPEVDKKQH